MKKTVSKLWEDIFKDYDVLNKIDKFDNFIITADEIRKYKEPRLMAKFDYYKQLPKIFKENNLGILPIKNGQYIIGKFSLFKDISNINYDDIEIKKVQLPNFIETIDPDNIYSESNALNVALLSGMFNEIFNEKFYETIQGKMRTNDFSFNISSKNINNKVDVNGVAIEIDGGYESKNRVLLVEAKNYMPEDFIIRQLYYPYRYWNSKIKKEIVPIFFTYNNGIYNIFIYYFEDLNNYNSIKLKYVKRFIVSNKTTEEMKKEIFNKTNLIEELPQNIVPFPQADSFSKVINVMELIGNDINTPSLISKEFNFNVRQGKYYIDALRYLGIVGKTKKKGIYELTDFGLNLIKLDLKNRNRKLIEEIFKHKPFYDTYNFYQEFQKMPEKDFIKNKIREAIPTLSEETINRRASTIKGWIWWIIGTQI